jgi:hypothetical protein
MRVNQGSRCRMGRVVTAQESGVGEAQVRAPSTEDAAIVALPDTAPVASPDPAALVASPSTAALDLIPVYTALASRRTAFDTLMWQTPALALTAQAFLFTISLAPDSAPIARYISSALDVIVAIVAIQTMAKHRYNEFTDSLLLEEIERGLGIVVSSTYPHAKPRDRGEAVGNRQSVITRPKSFRLWYLSLAGFGAASVAVIILTAVAPSLFSS